jgi:hypothetical protein
MFMNSRETVRCGLVPLLLVQLIVMEKHRELRHRQQKVNGNESDRMES